MTTTFSAEELHALSLRIKSWGKELGFQQVGVANIDLYDAERHLRSWLEDGFHGTMAYMEVHGSKRSRPAELIPGTVRVISARLDYLPESRERMEFGLSDDLNSYISRYALGRDYHKVLRSRLKALAMKIEADVGSFGYRVFTDSAPVLEKALAEKAGLGWIGKHSNLISRDAGSWFFLGEIYTDIPLPPDQEVSNHCGECQACLNACPTQAIVGPYRVDARRCISYLTIELRTSIPLEFRTQIGNRIYGCDDCQIVCPWNRFARLTCEDDFQPRHGLNSAQLVKLFEWSEADFLKFTEGSAIRRIGFECWLRNLAVALGNCQSNDEVVRALTIRKSHPSELVREHVEWSLERHQNKLKLGF